MIRAVLGLSVLHVAAAKTCSVVSGMHYVTGGNDAAKVKASTVQDCAAACEANSRCCVAEFDSNSKMCYLKYAGAVKGAAKGIYAVQCNPTCGGGPAPPTPPAPTPPAPPTPPSPVTPTPPPAPTPPATPIPVGPGRQWWVNNSNPAASDSNDGSQAHPFRTVSAAAAKAQAGDTVIVGAGTYRERVAPAHNGTEKAPITFMAAPGERVVLTAANVLKWTPSTEQGGCFMTKLENSTFDTLDGTPNTPLYNPFLDWMQPHAGCKSKSTGQVFADEQNLPEEWLVDLHKCGTNPWKPDGCFAVNRTTMTLYARFPKRYNGTMPASVEVTVRSRVFAPHKRGLQYIVVQGFIIEKAANQWCANFWFPQNLHYAQSGALGTRSGYRWTVRNNTIRNAKTIGFDWGMEGGYKGAPYPADNEGTNQSDPLVHGEHTVEHNVFERNGVSGCQGYGANGDFRYNLIQDNGGEGCSGAENAAFKSHGYHGTFEGNVFRRNSVGLPIWFDDQGGAAHVTRNVIIRDSNRPGQAIFVELGVGPVVADNNILVGSQGIVAQDVSGTQVGHNLIVASGGYSVDLHGLTGRGNTPMKDWWMGGNMMLTGGTGPWLHIHNRKVFAGKDAIQNETAQHNLITGGAPAVPPNQPGDLNITVSPNQDAAGSSFSVVIDRDEMVVSIMGDAVLDKTACQVGGAGGDRDFTGAKRTGSKCVPGPFASLVAGQRLNVSLWPTGGSW